MEIFGHTSILQLLPKLSAQSFLFTGAEGLGRRAVAKWFARGLNCANGFPPCGVCSSCRLEQHPDYFEIAPDDKTKEGKKARNPHIRLEQIAPRDDSDDESLLSWLQTYPRFKHKIAVIDSAHLLGESAANALLKALEEPPKYAKIILVAPSREVVLPTLVSRSLEVSFSPLPKAEMAKITSNPEILDFAEGSVGKAKWALENPQDFELLCRLTQEAIQATQQNSQQTLEKLTDYLAATDGLGFLAKKLSQSFGINVAAHKNALEAIAKAQDASNAYVSQDLVNVWLSLNLAKSTGK